MGWSARERRMDSSVLLLVVLAARSARGDEPREWYEGDISRVPDYHLFPRQPLNGAGKALLFSCSAATRDAVRFRWRVEHPASVNVSLGSRSRSIYLERGLYVRDSLLRLSSASPHDGAVHCKVLGPDGEPRTQMRVNYSVLASVGLELCARHAFCHRDRATCVLDEDRGLACRCKPPFPLRDPFHGVCYSGRALGDACVFDHECAANDSWCQEQACACRPSFERGAAGGGCVATARLGEPCAGARCPGRHASCRAGVCSCDEGHRDVDGVCVATEPLQRAAAATEPPRDSSTGITLAAFGLLLSLVTLFHTLADLRGRKSKAPAPQRNP